MVQSRPLCLRSLRAVLMAFLGAVVVVPACPPARAERAGATEVIRSATVVDQGAKANGRATSAPDARLAREVIFAEGASNTAGIGAGVGFDDRIRAHLATTPDGKEFLRALKHASLRVCVAFDLFFPTGFPAYLDERLSAADIERAARARILELKTKYDYIILSDELDLESLADGPRMRERLALPQFAPVRQIAQVLGRRPMALRAVNRAVRAAAAEDATATRPGAETTPSPASNAGARGRVLLAPMSAVFMPLFRDGGYRAPTTEGEPSPKTVPLSDLFQADGLHLTLNGQVAVYNLLTLPALRRLPVAGARALTSMPLSVADDVTRATIMRILSQPARELAQGRSGIYMLKADLEGAPGQAASGVLTTNFARLGESVRRDARVALGIREFEAIRSMIETFRSFAVTSPPVIAVRLSAPDAADRRRTLTLDLRGFAYAWVDLKETKPGSGVFEGTGVDFWSSLEGRVPAAEQGAPAMPVVRYLIRASLAGAGVRLTWWAFPPLLNADGGTRERLPLVRRFGQPEDARVEARLEGIVAGREASPFLRLDVDLRGETADAASSLFRAERLLQQLGRKHVP